MNGSRSTAWAPLLSGADQAEAVRVAREVAERLRDPDRLAGAIAAATTESEWPEYVSWEPHGLAQGHPGLALVFGQLDACFPGEGWHDAAHEQIKLSAAGLSSGARVSTGLYAGLSGAAFAVSFVRAGRYGKLLSTLGGLIARRVTTMLDRMDAHGPGCAEFDIDVVSGLAGVGAHLLARGDEASLGPILERLVRLILADGPIPAWHAPPELLDGKSRQGFPDGRLNCGLAHGLPGPLALLALASSAGARVDGLDDAVRCAAAWLVEHAVPDDWGVNWPYSAPVGGEAASDGPARAGWCYGAPGVSRSLWLAGAALGDAQLQELAVDALERVFRRPRKVLRLDSPTFCHGVAGVLQITLRMIVDSGSERLRAAAADLTEELLGRFEPDSILGYRDLDPDDRPVDQAGLLQGAAGPALVLIAAAAAEQPRWDRAFLLA